MKERAVAAMRDDGESPWTEITIQPDGRVYVFGLSLPVLEALARVPAADPKLQRLLARLRGTTALARLPASEKRET